jgi:eukaryotic-like serine/threonine-protein kinase
LRLTGNNYQVTGERKKLIDEIFLGAADLQPAQRSAFLAVACPDLEIATEVNSLLQYDGANAAILDSAVWQAAASLISSDPLIGTRLGPYRITEQLGKGGMGTVFLAMRDDQTFEKKVAVKVVKRGMDSEAVLDRFRHERRILANLDHPYIGRLLDAGTTPDGRPYFVMEYVEGQPIVAYAASQNLDLNAVLDLFRKVCDAVSCAHRNLVVHRDLKASNILVATDGSPKLLDFGIAKLLDPQNRAENTAPAGRLLTLDCASPEQIRGDTVTTSTDIYSLGILLFELLAGRPPWDFNSVSTSQAEQIICTMAAPRPSSSISAHTKDRPGHSNRWRALAGDLDNIVLMALRKDPARRYRSVDEFSEDLYRYRTGLPVIAREDSVSYRGAKFLRRHWVSAALASIAVLALLAGIVYANMERRRAEVRLTQMLGMADQTLLDLQSQIERQPGSTEARMRITQSTLAYLAGLENEAGNNQEVRTTLAKAYSGTGDIQGYPDSPNMGDSSGALASYEKAEKLFGANDHVPLARLFWHRGVVLFKLGRVPEGLGALRKGIDEASHADSHESLVIEAGAYHSLAYAITPSNPEEALIDSHREMDIFSKLVKREPANVEVLNGLAGSNLSIGGALLRRNRLEEALACFRKAAEILEPLAVNHPNDVMIRRDLMNAYIRTGDTLGNPARRNLGNRRGALPYYRKAQTIGESLAAADPTNNLAHMDLVEIRWRVATVMDGPEQTRESLAILDATRATAICFQQGKELNTSQYRAIATIDEFRGWRLSALGDWSAAIVVFQQAIEEAQKIAHKDSTDSNSRTLALLDYSGLCRAYASLGRRDEAFRCARKAMGLAAEYEVSGPDRASMAIFVPRAHVWLAAVYEALARKDASPQQRRDDWMAAAESYSRASESWQKLHARPDIFRYQAEIAESSKKVTDCTHRANSRG